jgi:hypothetical protein
MVFKSIIFSLLVFCSVIIRISIVELNAQRPWSQNWYLHTGRKAILWPNIGTISFHCENGLCEIECTEKNNPEDSSYLFVLDGEYMELVNVDGRIFIVSQQHNRSTNNNFKVEGNRIIHRKSRYGSCFIERKIMIHELIYPFSLKVINEWNFDFIHPFGFKWKDRLVFQAIAADWNCIDKTYSIYQVDLLAGKKVEKYWLSKKFAAEALIPTDIFYSEIFRTPIVICLDFDDTEKFGSRLKFIINPELNLSISLKAKTSDDSINDLTPRLLFLKENIEERSISILYYWESKNKMASFFQMIKFNSNGCLLTHSETRLPYQFRPILGSESWNNEQLDMNFAIYKLYPDSSTLERVLKVGDEYFQYIISTENSRKHTSYQKIEGGVEYEGFHLLWRPFSVANISFNYNLNKIIINDTTLGLLKLNQLNGDEIFYMSNGLIYSF